MRLEVRPAMSTAPTTAVPSEAPKLVKVFWRPPTSALWLSGAPETVTAPSWDARRPDPETNQGHGDEDDAGVGAGVEPGHEHHGPAQDGTATRPRTTSRGDARGASRRDERGQPTRGSPTAGRIRRPV